MSVCIYIPAPPTGCVPGQGDHIHLGLFADRQALHRMFDAEGTLSFVIPVIKVKVQLSEQALNGGVLLHDVLMTHPLMSSFRGGPRGGGSLRLRSVPAAVERGPGGGAAARHRERRAERPPALHRSYG